MMAKQTRLHPLLCLMFFITSVFAHSGSLEVSPHICVVSNAGDKCNIAVKINIELQDQEEACLVLSPAKQHLACFTNGLHQLVLNLELIDSTALELVNRNGEIVAQKVITVSRLNRNDYRVKRRFGWGI
ncbi:DUF3019 domain-containing protein [Pseudoalteromonas fenneropenaei]|uniref:DUF3019 domain-containing protein n=1 Tax=Pseudoalteromonas fenneropenaei TaxID=1737459 RepID=A0ABV7CET4_9GAMM